MVYSGFVYEGERQEKQNMPPHSVPLSRQIVTLLRELKKGSNSDYLFPSACHKNKCITDAAPLAALKRFEFYQTVHGFKTIASTHLHKMNFPTQIIEPQMAHKDKNEGRTR